MKNLSIISLLLLVLVVFVPSAFAKQEGMYRLGGAQEDQGGSRVKMQGKEASREGKMTACRARGASVKNRMAHLAQLVTLMEKVFDTHAQRVEDYYTNKVVASGKTVENYDALVANIQTKKAAVDAALATAKIDAEAFDCATGMPKEQVTKFRKDMQAVKAALKDYRTAIKNLIVAIRSVNGEAGGMTPTGEIVPTGEISPTGE